MVTKNKKAEAAKRRDFEAAFLFKRQEKRFAKRVRHLKKSGVLNAGADCGTTVVTQRRLGEAGAPLAAGDASGAAGIPPPVRAASAMLVTA